MPGKPTRTSLEPLAPAILGIGMAVLLLGVLCWTLLPVFAPDDADAGSDFHNEGLVWRKPAEFMEIPQEKPEPEPTQKPAAELNKAPPTSAPLAVVPPKQEPATSAKKVTPEASPSVPKAVAPVPKPAPAANDGLEYSISSASGMDALLARRMTAGLSTQFGGGLSAKGGVAGRREAATGAGSRDNSGGSLPDLA